VVYIDTDTVDGGTLKISDNSGDVQLSAVPTNHSGTCNLKLYVSATKTISLYSGLVHFDVNASTGATASSSLNGASVNGGSVHATTTDVIVDTAGKGVVLTNAADTVTKRVRLNDAGDGLIFENV